MGGIDAEHRARVAQFLPFKGPEYTVFLIAALLAGLVFSLRFPGEAFSLGRWFGYFLWGTAVAFGSLLARVAWQKVVGLKRGYYVEYQIVWGGVAASLLVSILSLGYIPLLVFGAVTTTFMVRHRLGEFRYGSSYQDVAMVIMWSIIVHLIIAAIFAFLLYAFPTVLLFKKAMLINLMFAAVTLLPLPTLDGIQLLFGDRNMYFIGILAVLFFGGLLITQTRIGLLIGLLIGAIIGVIAYFWSE